MYSLFATCPKYLEELLQQELQLLGAHDCKLSVAGVRFESDLKTVYRICLWSRLANRILLQLEAAHVESKDDIYSCCAALDWSSHMARDATFAVDFVGTSKTIRNSHFGALLVKDAIVDHFSASGERPSVDLSKPEIRINARLAKGALHIALDVSGDSLHKRGYREFGGQAPLKENLAAALLLRANWPALAQQRAAMVDPMCGSATLLIEAALMAADIAPAINRKQFGFHHWRQHDTALWLAVREQALARRALGLQKHLPDIRGYDADPRVIKPARRNIANAGLEDVIEIKCRPIAELVAPSHAGDTQGLVVTNPPYGERLSEQPELEYLYASFGARLKQEFAGWQVAVITANNELAQNMRLRSDKRYRFFNGAIASELWLMKINTASATQTGMSRPPPTEPKAAVLSNGAVEPALVNRLQKNRKKLRGWLRSAVSDCYRLYDADIPEYAAAVDIYADWAVVAEYAAPQHIDSHKAKQRFDAILASVAAATGLAPQHIVSKRRQRQSGKQQYQKLAAEHNFITVREDRAKFLVNLHDYIDTGLFLDHRPLRRMLSDWARDAHFLNLFCYTATATVHAALGGAKRSTSIDMSRSYIAWAKKNLALNGLSEATHELLQADCMEWLRTAQTRYDLLFLDPPSFSNSKRMREELDVQRDHAKLIGLAMQRLNYDGKLLFSTNRRRFQLDAELAEQYVVQDISAQTIDIDFTRRPGIHRCWVIEQRNSG
ncbi:MAG: bifunctional 23S rRNA (guanine(2069)-N(7))-methyltransferase RlmK/23S rRNA (guanine(2445)-N(2))-methyltransferase RlmL [Pseudomonadales bacterium]